MVRRRQTLLLVPFLRVFQWLIRLRQSALCDLLGRFYPPPGPDVRARVRGELGLEETAFVVLLLFGGNGSPEMRPLSQALLREPGDVRVIAVCGDNPRLLESMAEVEAGAGRRRRRLGFTDRVADYLAACDLLVTKQSPVRRVPRRLDYFRARLAALPPNRAVFEVLDLIAEALETATGARERYALPRERAGRGSSQGTGSSQ